MKTDNKIWSDNIIRKLDPAFLHRWQVFNLLLCENLSHKTIWFDIGCGNNDVVRDFYNRAYLAVGVDLQLPQNANNCLFVCADVHHLPFRSEIAHLVTLRFVVEHLKNIPEDFSEIIRILKPNGQILIITTNIWCPFVFLPRLLPFPLKKAIIRFLLKVKQIDIHTTFHRFNSFKKMKKGVSNLKLTFLDYIQDANYNRRLLFLIFFFWHLITRQKYIKFLRSCIISIFKKC